MEKACLHCKQRLSFLRAVRGELFCSSDHRELYLQAEAALAFERVAFFDSPTPPEREVAEAPPAPVETKKPILEEPPARVTTPPVAEAKPEPVIVKEIAEPAAAPPRDPSPAVPEATAPVAPEPGELVSISTAKPRRPIPIWLAPGIAAGLAILVLGALFFGPSRKSAHSSLPHVMPPLSAAEQDVNIAQADSPPRQVSMVDSKVPSPAAPAPPPAPPAVPTVPTKPAVLPPIAPPPKAEALPKTPATVKPSPPAIPPVSAAPSPAPVAPAPIRVAISEPGSRHAAAIRATQAIWVAACSDGKEVLSRALAMGETREIEFSGKAIVRTGNAGGTEISVDGKPIGSVGPAGALRIVELDPHGFHLLSLEPGDKGHDCRSN